MSNYKPPLTLFRSIKELTLKELDRLERLHRIQKEEGDYIEQRHKERNGLPCPQFSGIPTGLIDIDKTTDGLPYGISVVGARPEDGLTDFGLNVALNASHDYKVVYLSQTIDASLLIRRLIHINSKISFKNSQEGFLAERDFPRLTCTLNKLIDYEKNSRLSISNYPIDFTNFNEKCREMKEEKGTQLLIVDRFQSLFQKNNSSGDSGYWKAREIAEVLHEAVAEQGLALLLLSEVKKRPQKSRPISTEDLRDWGVFEYTGSPIITFETEKKYEELPEESCVGIKVNISNNWCGEITDHCNLIYIKSFGRFESAAKIDDFN